MRLPEFTAEASLRVIGEYAAFATMTGNSGDDSITAQFDYTTISVDTWGWLAHTSCQPPCQWDGFQCHCYSDLFPGVR